VGPYGFDAPAATIPNAYAASVDHFLSDALAQITILLYYNIKLKDGTITLTRIQVAAEGMSEIRGPCSSVPLQVLVANKPKRK